MRVTIEQMRASVNDRYRSKIWEKKVARMSDTQIIAVYNRFLNTPPKPWFYSKGEAK